MTAFVAYSRARGGGFGNITADGHPTAQAGDLQLAFYSTHSSVGAATITDFTLFSTTKSAHSSLYIYKRFATASNANNAVTVPAIGAGVEQGLDYRTYRGASDAIVVGNGLGLVSPSRVVDGLLLRAVAEAISNASSFPPQKTLSPDPTLLNGVADNYTWYHGLTTDDDPTASGSTAPVRTATSTAGAAGYPQWVDLALPNSAPPIERRLASVQAEALTSDTVYRKLATSYVSVLWGGQPPPRQTVGVYAEVLVKAEAFGSGSRVFDGAGIERPVWRWDGTDLIPAKLLNH